MTRRPHAAHCCLLAAFDPVQVALGGATSGGQIGVWMAVYGPRDEATGMPRPLWGADGAIDAEVATYWRDNYDLSHIIARDWNGDGATNDGGATLATTAATTTKGGSSSSNSPKGETSTSGSSAKSTGLSAKSSDRSSSSAKGLSASLRGKIHVWVGTMDAYYLDAAVYLTEDRLATLDPPADADFRYGTSHGRAAGSKRPCLAVPPQLAATGCSSGCPPHARGEAQCLRSHRAAAFLQPEAALVAISAAFCPQCRTRLQPRVEGRRHRERRGGRPDDAPAAHPAARRRLRRARAARRRRDELEVLIGCEGVRIWFETARKMGRTAHVRIHCSLAPSQPDSARTPLVFATPPPHPLSPPTHPFRTPRAAVAAPSSACPRSPHAVF